MIFSAPFLRLGSALFALALLAGCAGLLPKVQKNNANFASFNEAKNAVNSLVPMKSNLQSLAQLGIDPASHANINILTYSAIYQKLTINTSTIPVDVDPGVSLCLQAQDKCTGYELNESNTLAAREGNFFADLFNFYRHTHSTGWNFNAIILVLDGTVVYRSWGGQSNINEIEIKTNPLGPLQP